MRNALVSSFFFAHQFMHVLYMSRITDKEFEEKSQNPRKEEIQVPLF
jgi:hypothetical protein